MLTYSKIEEMKSRYVEMLAERHAQAMQNRAKQYEEQQIEQRKKITHEIAKQNKDQFTINPQQQTLTPQKVIPKTSKHHRSKSSMIEDTPVAFADMFHH